MKNTEASLWLALTVTSLCNPSFPSCQTRNCHHFLEKMAVRLAVSRAMPGVSRVEKGK